MAFGFNLNLSLCFVPKKLLPRGVLTMSWLDDEADDDKRKEQTERHSEEVLRRSQYWAAIVARLGQEVEAINQHAHWKPKLAGFPLVFRPPTVSDGNTYQIHKSGLPAVIVEVQHKLDHILIGRAFTENPLSRTREFKTKEKLRVGTMGDQVVLITENEETLVVPEHAVQYILKAVIESLKLTKLTK